MDELTVDYTQFSSFLNCQLYWYEKYIRGVQKKWAVGQREDALALGILYHNGMENMYKHGQASISPQVIEEIGPTPEALNMIHGMLIDYRRVMYPNDKFKVEGIEQPLTLRLSDHIKMLAKIDMYVRVTEPLKIYGGSSQDTLVLNPGIWGFEDKTKNKSMNMGAFAASYRMSWQPIFQTLVLREKFGDEVQGVIINVAEKNDYKPKRKCRGCSEYSLYEEWIPQDAEFKCPICGHLQKLIAVKPEKLDEPTTFFRMKFTIPDNANISLKEFLDAQIDIIKAKALEMYDIKYNDGVVGVNWDRCIPRGSYYRCDFAEAHTNLRDPMTMEEFEVVENPGKYMGVQQ